MSDRRRGTTGRKIVFRDEHHIAFLPTYHVLFGYVIVAVSIDVLAPDGLGSRTDLTTPPGRTLQVPGGAQALARTEFVPVTTSTLTGRVPRPSLLGAIICKAVAVRVDDAPDAQRLDLAFLLGLVDDPFELIDQLNATDRRRLRARIELADETNPVWRRLPLERTDRARAALRLLQG